MIVATLLLFGCSRDKQQTVPASSTTTTSDSATATASKDSATATASKDSATATTAQNTPPARTGPRLLLDSAATEPRIDTTETEYVIHLPISFARALQDSFPNFVPVTRQNYTAGFVAVIDAQEPERAPLSATVGDFDGDGKGDIAMLGYPSNDTYVFVILLSGTSPTLRVIEHAFARGSVKEEGEYISLEKPQRFTGYGERGKTTLNLSTDAIRKVIIEHLSLLLYMDHGAVKQLQLSEPD